jgi:hypothetical protein
VTRRAGVPPPQGQSGCLVASAIPRPCHRRERRSTGFRLSPEAPARGAESHPAVRGRGQTSACPRSGLWSWSGPICNCRAEGNQRLPPAADQEGRRRPPAAGPTRTWTLHPWIWGRDVQHSESACRRPPTRDLGRNTPGFGGETSKNSRERLQTPTNTRPWTQHPRIRRRDVQHLKRADARLYAPTAWVAAPHQDVPQVLELLQHSAAGPKDAHSSGERTTDTAARPTSAAPIRSTP